MVSTDTRLPTGTTVFSLNSHRNQYIYLKTIMEEKLLSAREDDDVMASLSL
jgi:hypothetical protein